MRRQQQEQVAIEAEDREPALAESLHDRFSRLGRQLRSIELPKGITQERLSVLGIVEARGPISVTALADHERVRPATMSRMVSALESDGYVRRISDENDGRGVLVAATDLGREAFAKAREQRLARLSVALESLSDAERKSMGQLAGALEQLTQLLDETSK
jgi:DNA-binding MarR family transcriptional regulator